MFKNTASQKLTVIAFADAGHATLDAGEPVTGDASNITCKVEQDDDGTQSATNDVNPSEVEDGQYRFDLTQAETNGDKLTFYPESSTAGVQVVALPSNVIYTRPPNFPDMGIESDGDLTKVNTLDGHTAQTGDSFARIGANGVSLSAIPWNASWDAEVQSEVNDGLVALGLDHLVGASVTGTDITDDSIIAKLVSSQATADWDDFVNTTDSLQAIRDHIGDGTNLTEAGGTGDHLTAIPWNASWDTEVQSEVNDGLVALGLDHLVGASVTGTDITDDSIVAKLVSSSATADWDDFVNTTDSLQALRDHVGDGTNLTEAGGTGDHLTALATASALTTAQNDLDTITGSDGVFLATSSQPAGWPANLAASAGQIIKATVDTATNSHTPTTTVFQADDITEATADHYNGRVVIFTSGALAGQATDITDYEAVGGIGQFTVTAMTEAPANNDTFVIV